MRGSNRRVTVAAYPKDPEKERRNEYLVAIMKKFPREFREMLISKVWRPLARLGFGRSGFSERIVEKMRQDDDNKTD
jgi:hypothetical protein